MGFEEGQLSEAQKRGHFLLTQTEPSTHYDLFPPHFAHTEVTGKWVGFVCLLIFNWVTGHPFF
jgi:hypothetical protein